MRKYIGIIISAAIALAATSCERSAKVVPKKQTEADKTRAAAKGKHPDAIDFRSGAFDDIYKRDGFTIEIQDRIADAPKQLYWVSSDDFGIYRTPKGIFAFFSADAGYWVELRCSKEQAASIIETNKEFPKVKSLLFFSLSSASPLHVEMKAEYDPGSPGDEDSGSTLPLSSIVAEDIRGQFFKGDLVEASPLDPVKP